MRKVKYFILILFIGLIGILNAKAINISEKIYDFANVLTPNEEALLKEKIDKFIEDYNMDMAIVTVKYHDYDSTKEYADTFYDVNGFGLNDNKDGVVFVIDFSTKLYNQLGFWISASGRGMIVYSNSRIEKLLDYIDDAFNANNTNYYNMCDVFVTKATSFAYIGTPKENKNVKITKTGMLYEEKPFPWMGICILSIIIPSIVVIILIMRNKMVRKAKNADLYIEKDTVEITNRSDRFVTTATTRVRISSSSSSSGGISGHVGGTSFHSSSSGSFHSGGGRSH